MKLNSRLSFLPPFTCCKKCLEFFQQDVDMRIKYSVFFKTFEQHWGKKKALLIKTVYFLKLQPLCGFYTKQNLSSMLDHFWCCSSLFYRINLVMLNNLLCILLILKQIKFTKQRRKRIIRVGFGKSGAVVHRCFWIWVFLKILQISQENICVEVSF